MAAITTERHYGVAKPILALVVALSILDLTCKALYSNRTRMSTRAQGQVLTTGHD